MENVYYFKYQNSSNVLSIKTYSHNCIMQMNNDWNFYHIYNIHITNDTKEILKERLIKLYE